jgi:hypothetical protein
MFDRIKFRSHSFDHIDMVILTGLNFVWRRSNVSAFNKALLNTFVADVYNVCFFSLVTAGLLLKLPCGQISIHMRSFDFFDKQGHFLV